MEVLLFFIYLVLDVKEKGEKIHTHSIKWQIPFGLKLLKMLHKSV